jgi:hypothetical protein
MAEAKNCARCQRGIDRWARICPFCNWNQSDSYDASQEVPPPVPVAEYSPPEEKQARKLLFMAGGAVLLLVASFTVGVVINRADAPKRAPETLESQLEEHKRESIEQLRADTPLVPVNGPAGIEQPITSAPVDVAGAAPGQRPRTDATAVSAAEYARMAERAAEEKKRAAAATDPRSITGEPYTPRPMTSASSAREAQVRTRPVPRSQPLPNIDGRGKARLTLLIGKDGRVRRVQVDRPLERNTAQLVRAVQSWTFRPATENGEPVAAPYSVEIKYQR